MRLVSLFALATLVACGGGAADPCEKIANTAEAKAEECDLATDTDTTTADTAEVECPYDATYADCVIACWDEAPCGAFDGTDLDAGMALGTCLMACMPADTATDTDTAM